MKRRLRIALVGVGKIARDQHLPALASSPDFELVAAASLSGSVSGIHNFTDIHALLNASLDLDAVSFCTPPQGRWELARAALHAGMHVMLEKPPCATVSQALSLETIARATGRTLFASWHSREAGGVADAKAWLARRVIRRVRVTWKEDVRQWHPGQDWILAAGGLGVFDPGINALSIVTELLPGPVALESARLSVPANRQSPIAASLSLTHETTPVTVELDFLHSGVQRWDVEVETDDGHLRLARGGAQIEVTGAAPVSHSDREYSRLYARFRALIESGRCDVDVGPLRIVADAFLIAERTSVDPFEF